MNKAPFFWDNYSDQPQVIKDRAYKNMMRKRYFFDYAKMFFTSIFIFPIAFLAMKFFSGKKSEDIFGLGVSLDKGEVQVELVRELGVKHLLLRVPLWEVDRLQEYVAFASLFKGCSILVNVMQDREHIEDPNLLRSDLKRVFVAFDGISSQFQIGTTINRAKWGFFSVSEFLNFFGIAQELRDEMGLHVELLGPSVIDFEYYYNARAMFNAYKFKFDKVSALLYVDRRGSPNNAQYGIFDTKNKIELLYSLVKLSPKCSDEIYITEVNWPLSGTAPYAPTSEKECVSNEEYCEYMHRYYEIAKESKKVQRVYWHQLIAHGYGLVSDVDGEIEKLPQFYKFKQMVSKF